MSRLTNSSKAQQGFHLAIILSFLVMLVLPIFIPTYPIQDERIIHLTIEESLPSAENPYLNLTYHHLSNLTEVNVVSDSVIAGDHVTLKASWNPALINESRLEIFAPAIPVTLEENQNLSITEIDTRYLGNNATCTIIATGWLANGSSVFETFENVYIGNFFVPKITVISPNGDEIWTGTNNITWDASDVNVVESLLYDVHMSSDGGATFDILATSISNNWLEWNCSALDKLDTYLVEVRVTDGIYFSSDRSESTFTAGEIVPTTTTSTTTTTTTGTNTTPTLDPRLTAFVVILVVSSSVMAIVVYYAAKKWF